MDTDKLRKALLMALSSGHDGEVLAAVNSVKKQLKAAGHDIHWLADKLSATDHVDIDDDDDDAPPTWHGWPGRSVVAWREQLRFLSEDSSLMLLRPKEFDFIMSLGEQRARATAWWPTSKQETWLADIYRRVHAQRQQRR